MSNTAPEILKTGVLHHMDRSMESWNTKCKSSRMFSNEVLLNTLRSEVWSVLSAVHTKIKTCFKWIAQLKINRYVFLFLCEAQMSSEGCQEQTGSWKSSCFSSQDCFECIVCIHTWWFKMCCVRLGQSSVEFAPTDNINIKRIWRAVRGEGSELGKTPFAPMSRKEGPEPSVKLTPRKPLGWWKRSVKRCWGGGGMLD